MLNLILPLLLFDVRLVSGSNSLLLNIQTNLHYFYLIQSLCFLTCSYTRVFHGTHAAVDAFFLIIIISFYFSMLIPVDITKLIPLINCSQLAPEHTCKFHILQSNFHIV